MGLLTKLFMDSADEEFKLAQDLVAIAMADGEISEAERKVINDICKKEGILDETINDYMLGFDDDVDSLIPADRREKMAYLSKLVRVMGVDGNCANMEIYLLEIIASKLGISHMDLVSIVLMTATHSFFLVTQGQELWPVFYRMSLIREGRRCVTTARISETSSTRWQRMFLPNKMRKRTMLPL